MYSELDQNKCARGFQVIVHSKVSPYSKEIQLQCMFELLEVWEAETCARPARVLPVPPSTAYVSHKFWGLPLPNEVSFASQHLFHCLVTGASVHQCNPSKSQFLSVLPRTVMCVYLVVLPCMHSKVPCASMHA